MKTQDLHYLCYNIRKQGGGVLDFRDTIKAESEQLQGARLISCGPIVEEGNTKAII